MQESMAVRPAELPEYFKNVTDFESSKAVDADKSRRLAWRVAGVFGVLCTAAVIGLSVLGPMRVVIPYMFAVDKATGNVELVSVGGDRGMADYQDIFDKHWVQRYVTARESYNYKLLQKDYEDTLLMSGDGVARDYAKQFDGTNSIDKRLGAAWEKTVKVISVTLANDNVSSKAVVRFELTTKRTDAERANPPEIFVSTIAFEYKPKLFGKEKDLIRNPPGFKVIAYRRDSELAAPTKAQDAQ